MKRRWKTFQLLLKRIYRKVVRASGTPHEVALGVAVGFVVAWLPIVGIQMVVAVAACTALRCNRVVPLFPVWLTNPATIVPIYSFNYWVGWKVAGGPGLERVKGVIANLLPAPREDGTGFFSNPFVWAWEWGVDFCGNVKHNTTVLWDLGWDMQLPLWLGCVIVGTALAVPSYYLTRYCVRQFWDHVLRKRRLRHERLLALRERAEARRSGRRAINTK